VNHHRRSNVPVENATAVTAVCVLTSCLGCYLSTFRALLGGSPRIDLNKLDISICSFVFEHCGQLRPRGISNMLGQITPGQAFDVKILNPDPTETLDQIAGKLVQVITPSAVRA
jgi:hypothetical protein